MLRLPAWSLSAGRVGHRLSLVRHPQVKARDLLPGNPVTVAALLLAPQDALKALRPPERRLQLPARGEAQALAGLRQDGEVLRPEVHADDAWLSRVRGSPAPAEVCWSGNWLLASVGPAPSRAGKDVIAHSLPNCDLWGMTGIYWHDSALTHVTPPGHPERVARAEAVHAALSELEGLEWHDAPRAARAEVERCHPARHFDRIEAAIPESSFVALDADTHVSPGSLDAALHAVGGCNAAVDAVIAGEARTAFVAMRPPGHHAETETAMGFCLFGTAAIAAKRALDEHGLSRVAVLDFDVHHGNGTQDLLWNEERTLFASSHQMPLYPGTGAAHETGAHDNVLNAPLAPMTGSAEMRRAWGDIILPALDDFAPELVIVSAGFDAHASDPLANLNWTEQDFAWVTAAICEVAEAHAGGRVVSTLEGGYDLAALAASVAAHVIALREHIG